VLLRVPSGCVSDVQDGGGRTLNNGVWYELISYTALQIDLKDPLTAGKSIHTGLYISPITALPITRNAVP
jgi:hypothetical protein